MEEKQTELKMKISNAADNADITHLQARDTGHRRMQEVNRLYTDSGPLRANTVSCHSTQYSLLVAANFAKYWPIFKIFSPTDLAVNLQ